jgi:hypothetical protein
MLVRHGGLLVTVRGRQASRTRSARGLVVNEKIETLMQQHAPLPIWETGRLRRRFRRNRIGDAIEFVGGRGGDAPAHLPKRHRLATHALDGGDALVRQATRRVH